MNISHVFHDDPILTITFLILIGMSAASWYVILWKYWMMRKERRALGDFLSRHAAKTDWPRSVLEQNKITINDNSAVADLVDEGRRAAAASRGKDFLLMTLAQGLDRIRTSLNTGLTILASIGSSAPFIGLFGTVWGIYNALVDIAAQGNASLNVVAGPMGEALVATAAGLFAAIPAVLAYNAFVRMNSVFIQDLRHIAEQMAFYLAEDQAASPPVKIAAAGGR
jgi:biopolymer transport protein ExbB